MSDKEKTHGGGMDANAGPSERSERRAKWACDSDSWWEDRSLGEKIGLGIGIGILAVGLAALFGWIVMLLWNWLMPDIFGLKRVDYWHAWGLLILSCILFGKIGSGDGSRKSDRKRKRKLRSYMREERLEDEQDIDAPSEV